MVYIGIREPKKTDKYVILEIHDNCTKTEVNLTEHEALALATLYPDIKRAIQKLGDRIVKE